MFLFPVICFFHSLARRRHWSFQAWPIPGWQSMGPTPGAWRIPVLSRLFLGAHQHLDFPVKSLRRTCSVETPASVFVTLEVPTLCVLAALSGKVGQGMASACQRRPGWARPETAPALPRTSETKVGRPFHFAIYIWNLDSSKAAFLCPSQNVQINALCQG